MNQNNEHPSRPVVLITGVSRKKGIGFGVAKILAQNGYNLFLQGFPTFDATKQWGIDPGGLKAIGEELKGTGSQLETMECDFSFKQAPNQLIAAGVKAFSHLDVLIVNHAYHNSQSLFELTPDEIDHHLLINVRATLLLIKEFARQFKKDSGGRIIMMTSGQHLGPMPQELPYVASKGAIHQLTASLSDAVMEKGITLNTINPGPTDTGWPTDQQRQEGLKHFPQGRWGQSEDVAKLILWLISEEGGWITGQVINSEGGFRRS